MTWNVWWRFGSRWRERQRGIGVVVSAVAPDVLGLQEAWRAGGTSQPQVLAGERAHAAFVPMSIPPVPDPVESPDQADVEMGVGLVSRWPITDLVDHPLPARHRDPPMALVATLAHPCGPLHVIVACTEWEPQYVEDHRAQTRELARLMTDPAFDGDLPVLLLGDLNGAPDTEEIRPLHAVASDLWSAGGGDPAAITLSSATPDAPLEAVRQIDRRIDYAFARPGRPGVPLGVRESRLAGDRPVHGVFPSDHFAVVCELDP